MNHINDINSFDEESVEENIIKEREGLLG